VGAGVGVWVLAADQLEGLDLLERELVVGDEAAARSAEVLVEAGAEEVAVDGLGRVGVEHAPVDVGAVGQDVGVGVEDALDEFAGAGVGGEGGPLIGEGDQDVAVHLAANLALGAFDLPAGALPERRLEEEAVIVLARGLDFAHLEEGAGSGDGIEVAPEDAAVDAGAGQRRAMKDGRGDFAILGAEVVAGLVELGDGRGGDADPDVEFLLGVVIDEVELNVFVAAAFAGLGVGGAEEIELRALGGDLFLGGAGGVGGGFGSAGAGSEGPAGGGAGGPGPAEDGGMKNRGGNQPVYQRHSGPDCGSIRFMRRALLLLLPLLAPGQTMDIREYSPKSSLVVPENLRPKAKYPIIDAHSHQRFPMPAESYALLLEQMDALNLRVLVNLSGGYGDRLKNAVESSRKMAPGRFVIFASLDFRDIDAPDFPERVARAT
jgi:hypothetical protein